MKTDSNRTLKKNTGMWQTSYLTVKLQRIWCQSDITVLSTTRDLWNEAEPTSWATINVCGGSNLKRLLFKWIVLDIQRNSSPKLTFCNHLLTLIWFQSHITFIFLRNSKWDTRQNSQAAVFWNTESGWWLIHSNDKNQQK